MRTEFEKYLEDRINYPEKYAFIPTGIKALDIKLHGYYKNQVWVIAAWPGSGKTTLAMNFISKLSKTRISLFDTETTRFVFMERFFSLVSGIPHDVFSKNLNGNYPEIKSKLSCLDNFNLNIIDKSCPSFRDIEEEVKRFRPKFLIIDYIQNVDVGNPINRYSAYTNLVRDIETLTKRFELTTILCSQLRKPVENSSRPSMFDLKETGKLLEVPSVVLLLSRVEGGSMLVDACKNRNGQPFEETLSGNWNTGEIYG